MSKVKILSTIIALLPLLNSVAQVTFTTKGPYCIDNNIQFQNQSTTLATNFLWDFGDGETSTEVNPVHSYSLAGLYVAVLTGDFEGNSYSKTQNITIGSTPVANFTDTMLYFSSYTRIFTSKSTLGTGIHKYRWEFGDGSTLATDSVSIAHKYKTDGTYTVKQVVTDARQCKDSMEQTVTIEDIFIVPNVFTPNGDNLNDQFVVTSNGETKFAIEIYTRWGIIVFSRTGQQQIVWDGRMPDGSIVNPGTYYYVITAVDNNAKYEPEQGFITIFH